MPELTTYHRAVIKALNARDGLCLLATGIGWVEPLVALIRAHAARSNGGVVVLLATRPHQKATLNTALCREGLEPPVDVDAAISPLERLRVYKEATAAYVTCRILVCDLLCAKISAESMAGVFVLNAETASDNSGLEFAVRLFRLGNRDGFIRGVTDNPLFFYSLQKVMSVMQSLKVDYLSLWPRYNQLVKDDLDRKHPTFHEITPALSSAMSVIQDAIYEIMSSILTKLKNHEILDCSEMTVEKWIMLSYDVTARRLLERSCRKVSNRVKSWVEDMAQLRELVMALTVHDCVSFLSLLDTIWSVGGADTNWLYHDEAHFVFQQAARRVYVLADAAGPEPVKRRRGASAREAQEPSEGRAAPRPILEPLPKWQVLKDILEDIQASLEETTILVVCKEMFMKYQLQWGVQNPEKLLQTLFDEYVTSTPDVQRPRPTDRRGRRRMPELVCDFSLYAQIGGMEHGPSDKAPAGEASEETADLPRQSMGSLLYDEQALGEASPCTLLRNVHFYALDSKSDSILWELQPKYVIMCHADVSFLRQVELYQAQRTEKDVTLYLLYYRDSIEQAAFNSAVEREEEIFKNLIDSKKDMIVPNINQALQCGPVQCADPSTAARPQILLDMREFMSKLPAALHRHGFKLIPVTLEVGDYVLTPDIVVERKTGEDLRSSLKSGRMLNQVAALTQQCDVPVLLLQLDGESSSRLVRPDDIGRDISPYSIISRLVLLIRSFPSLRLIWSFFLLHTCEIFARMKQNRTEPVDNVALRQRRSAATSEERNLAAMDLLKKFPGVTDENCWRLMEDCRTLAGVAEKSLEALKQVMQSERNAKLLYDYLHKPV